MSRVSDQEEMPKLPENTSDETHPPDARPRALKAATVEPEYEAGASYLPKLPWRWLALAVVIGLGIYYGYQYRERERATAMREQILATHEQALAPIVERYRTFRERITDWTLGAVNGGEPERWSDPRLRVAGLHSGDGLYLRVRAADVTDADSLENAARAMDQDAITRCLGIAPSSARGLYENGEFLMPEFLDTVRNEPDFLRLRVIDETLSHNISVDVPIISTLLRSQYFLLVVQRGENRREEPVDVFLWDLGENRQLLRARIQARGVLIPVRIDRMIPGTQVARAPGVPSTTSGGANDCSIASQIRALTGDAAAEVGAAAVGALMNAEAEATTDAGVTADAGVPAAAATTETTPAAPSEAVPSAPSEAAPSEAAPSAH